MEKIIKILMRRDGISREEAYNLVEECCVEIHDILNNADINDAYSLYETISDILNFQLGLEPDFIEYFI